MPIYRFTDFGVATGIFFGFFGWDPPPPFVTEIGGFYSGFVKKFVTEIGGFYPGFVERFVAEIGGFYFGFVEKFVTEIGGFYFGFVKNFPADYSIGATIVTVV